MPATKDPPQRESALYRRVADRVIAGVRSGAFAPGDRLPSVRQTAADQGTSLLTAVRAYELLVLEGWAEASPRRGYFVAERPGPRVAAAQQVTQPRRVEIADRLLRLLAKWEGRRLVPLGSALPDPGLYPAAGLRRALSAAVLEEDSLVRYPNGPLGSPGLRSAIARRLALAGCGVAPDDIVVTNGCMEALSIGLRATTRPGDAVLVEAPNYYGILQTLEELDLHAIEVPADARDGVRLDAVAEALDAHRRVAACVLCTNFSSPLGSRMPDRSKQELVTLLGEHGVPLIEDDVYGDLAYDGTRPSVAKAYDREGSVLLAGSFSKSLAPGMRVGWLAPGAFREAALQLKFHTSTATAACLQDALSRYLAGGSYDRLLRKLRTTLRTRASAVSAAVLREFPPGTRVSDPQGGYVLWVQLPGGVDSDAFADAAIERGVSVFPGSLFSNSGAFSDCVRLHAGLEWGEPVEAAIATLGRLAAEMAGTGEA